MEKNFKDFGIIPPILQAVEEMGFEAPTEVQRKAIPRILEREDLIIISKTGSGKTAGFGVPILQMTEPEGLEPQALILAPTRELAIQVDNDLKLMSKHLKHQTAAVYGQHNINVEIKALSKGVDILTGTPGRVYDHIRRGNLKTHKVKFLVIDEADRMLDMGFIDQVVRIIKTLPKDRITLLFSATIPEEVRRICKSYMKTPHTIEIESQTKTVDLIQQTYYRVDRNEKRTQLDRLLQVEQPESCMIFCNTRHAVDSVQSFLHRKGYATQSLHGEIPQGKRIATIDLFKKGAFHILVATDVAARGIHIDDMAMVINYDVPEDKDSYVHRIGRTGRAGNTGRAITFVTGEDLMTLYEIEEHIGALISEEAFPTEEAVKARAAEADVWKKAKGPQLAPSDTSRPSKSASRPTRSSKPAKPSEASKSPQGEKTSRPRGPRKPRQDRPVESSSVTPAASGHSTEKATLQAKPASEAAKTAGDRRPTQHQNPNQRQRQHNPRQYHPHQQPPQAPPEVSAPAVKPVTERTQSQSPVKTREAKKPLFSRIVDQLLGRK